MGKNDTPKTKLEVIVHLAKALFITPFVLIYDSVTERPATELICPVCGYECLGDGGKKCIDKPYQVEMDKYSRRNLEG